MAKMKKELDDVACVCDRIDSENALKSFSCNIHETVEGYFLHLVRGYFLGGFLGDKVMSHSKISRPL